MKISTTPVLFALTALASLGNAACSTMPSELGLRDLAVPLTAKGLAPALRETVPYKGACRVAVENAQPTSQATIVTECIGDRRYDQAVIQQAMRVSDQTTPTFSTRVWAEGWATLLTDELVVARRTVVSRPPLVKAPAPEVSPERCSGCEVPASPTSLGEAAPAAVDTAAAEASLVEPVTLPASEAKVEPMTALDSEPKAEPATVASMSAELPVIASVEAPEPIVVPLAMNLLPAVVAPSVIAAEVANIPVVAVSEPTEAERVLKEWQALPQGVQARRLIEAVMTGTLPAGFERRQVLDVRRHTLLWNGKAVRAVGRVSAPGLSIAAVEFEVIGLEPQSLSPADFTSPLFSESAVDVDVSPRRIGDGVRRARAVVVEPSSLKPEGALSVGPTLARRG